MKIDNLENVSLLCAYLWESCFKPKHPESLTIEIHMSEWVDDFCAQVEGLATKIKNKSPSKEGGKFENLIESADILADISCDFYNIKLDLEAFFNHPVGDLAEKEIPIEKILAGTRGKIDSGRLELYYEAVWSLLKEVDQRISSKSVIGAKTIDAHLNCDNAKILGLFNEFDKICDGITARKSILLKDLLNEFKKIDRILSGLTELLESLSDVMLIFYRKSPLWLSHIKEINIELYAEEREKQKNPDYLFRRAFLVYFAIGYAVGGAELLPRVLLMGLQNKFLTPENIKKLIKLSGRDEPESDKILALNFNEEKTLINVEVALKSWIKKVKNINDLNNTVDLVKDSLQVLLMLTFAYGGSDPDEFYCQTKKIYDYFGRPAEYYPASLEIMLFQLNLVVFH